ncbi:MAG: hypothetical protein WD267_04150 [Balneolales bacterium]
MNNQINEARELLNKAFTVDTISGRNNLLREALDNIEKIEKSNPDQVILKKIKNIKKSYSKELLGNLYPSPSVEDDIETILLLLVGFNKNSLKFNFE